MTTADRDRLRLPRRGPRRVHGATRPRRRRHRRRRRQGRVAERRARRRSSSPGFPRCCRSALATGRLRFTSDMAEAQGRQVHFVCVGTPQKRNEYAADMAYVDAAVTALAPHLSPGDLVVGKSTVPVGTAQRLAERRRPSRAGSAAGLEPGVPPRGIRRAGHPAPRSARLRPAGRRGGRARQGAARRGLRDPAGARNSAGRHRLRDRRAGQGRGELLPGHQDLLHQRDGRGLRGQRRRRHASSPTRSATTPGSAAASSTPVSASAAAACPRTSGPSWPGPANSAPTRRWPSSARSTRSTCAAGSGWSTWPGSSAADRSSAGGSPCWGWRSSPTATTSATPRR